MGSEEYLPTSQSWKIFTRLDSHDVCHHCGSEYFSAKQCVNERSSSSNEDWRLVIIIRQFCVLVSDPSLVMIFDE